MKRVKRLLITAVAAAAISACDGDNVLVTNTDGGGASGGDGSMMTATGNIVQTAVDNGSFTTLAKALTATGLDAVLMNEEREFTVFAPTDDAFNELGADTINALLADPDTLSNILLYHVLADQNVDSATAISLAGNSVAAANEDDLQLSLSDGNLFINTAQVITADVMATNGTIHVIDKVLLPPEVVISEPPTEPMASNIVDTAIAAGSFTILAAALEAADLVSVLADESATYTVFAPTDEAFDELGQETIDALLADQETLRDILLYHVVPGQAVDSTTAISLAGNTVEMANTDTVMLSLDAGELFVNNARVTTPDVGASNGIIHVIDKVLLPPADEPPAEMLMSIYDTAIAAGNFTTLVTALQVTSLDGPLAGDHETYTVFAPTDDAFAVLGTDAINGLLADPDTLSNILLYHVVSDAAVDSTTAIGLAGTSVQMANGSSVNVSLKDGELFLNEAKVIATDIQASNGIIHVLDAVLIPH